MIINCTTLYSKIEQTTCISERLRSMYYTKRYYDLTTETNIFIIGKELCAWDGAGEEAWGFIEDLISFGVI